MTDDKRAKFAENHPNGYFLDAENISALTSYLHRKQWLEQEEVINDIQRAGEGNMNYTLRLITNQRSFIIKQARPWVEKYEQIPAPSERALVEGKFYEIAADDARLAAFMPKLLGSDSESCILIMEDLGNARDFSFVYNSGQQLTSSQLAQLLDYLSRLHTLSPASERKLLENRKMRLLNHEHIFRLPLQADNGLDLDSITPGLAESARRLQNDEKYKDIARTLGEAYLYEPGNLLHGDYYPGSWLETSVGVKVIDPEFCFCGLAEFDVGVMIAHLLLAEQSSELLRQFAESYRSSDLFQYQAALQFAGIEIMRRLIGVAQLPLSYGIDEKNQLLEVSHDLVLQKPCEIHRYFIH